MSRTNTAELILGANTQRLRQGLSSGSRDIQNFSTRTKTMLAGLGTSLKRNLLSIPGQLGFIGGTAGLFMLGRNIVKFDDQMNQLGIAGRLTKKEMFGLREEMFRVGLEVGRSQTSIAEGVGQIIELTGNTKFALATFRDLSIASQATGAAMSELGAMASQLDEKFQIKPTGLMEALDVLVGQGKDSAFTMRDLASSGGRLMAAANRLDMRGIKDLTMLGAYLQTAMSATNDPDLATTAVERTFSDILDKQIKLRNKYNIKIRESTGEYKKFDAILKEIIVKTGGDELKLGEIFTERSIRPMSFLASIYRRTGAFGKFDELLQGKYGGTITKDMEERTKSISVQIERLVVLMNKVGESSLVPSLEKINKYLQELLDDPEKLAELNNKFKDFGENIATIASHVANLAKHWRILVAGFGAIKLFGWGLALSQMGAMIPVITAISNGLATLGGTAAAIQILTGGLLAFCAQLTLIGAAIAGIIATIKEQYELEKQMKEDVDFYEKTGINRVLTTAGTEQSAAPAASLRNEIRLNIDVHVDKEGNKTYTGASVLDKPAEGVSQQTFLEPVFVGGDR